MVPEHKQATPLRIAPALTSEDIDRAAELMSAYKQALGLHIFDNPAQQDDETLPGPYGAAGAGILLAWRGTDAVGVVAYKGLSDTVAEMKRMYVAPDGRGAGTGRMLALAVLDAARADGYTRMLLDTLGRLTEARRLYESLGFERIARYNSNPVEGVVFYGVDL